MLLRVEHCTHYQYTGTVNMSQHLAHLVPRAWPSQTVLSHSLAVDPPPAFRDDSIDVYGNHRCFLTLQAPHEHLEICAESLVETHTIEVSPALKADGKVAWNEIRDRYRYCAGAPYDPAVEFVFASPMVPINDLFAEFADDVFRNGRGVLDACIALMNQIHAQLKYDPASTEVSTPALDALAQGKGVCQDFAHIMIGCLRTLGLPARYVSGYLLTQPPEGQPRLIGADASHAWVSVYIPTGGEVGFGQWVDFDPTNDRWGVCSPGEDYVTLAIGRDFSDVSPLRGVIQGGAQHTLEVGVTVAPPAEWPEPEAVEAE